MRVTQHNLISRTRMRPLFVGGVLMLALSVAGCSAVNMTGFSFPVFGLTKKSSDDSDALTTSSIPDDAEKAGSQPQSLTSQ